nr:DUF1926 domain-containing protein [candidate division Zixibacteria bacterium]
MDKFKLAIGIHNHQPVGNFDSVFDEAHNRAYMPFLKLFEQFTGLRLSLHQSGILWDWQEDRYPAYFDLVQSMIYDNRIELMTGGFYEPILPSIPDNDKLGQIEMLSRYLAGKFGADVSGLWLTERVWEPHLPKVLKMAGVEYLPVDDTHFLYAGFEPDQLRGVFITEEEGATIKLLPIQKKLRYLIPFATVDKVMDELKRQAETNPGGLAVYADDGEKFGVWPKTYQHCYEDKWLEHFFEALANNSDWLEVITLEEASRTKPVGRAYLPTASYAEMLHWSLPPKAFAEYEEFEEWLKKEGKLEKYGRYVRGGHWRGFLAKYDENNLMHKRMLLVSSMLADYAEKNPTDYMMIDKIKPHLYAAQCNCAYWHGVFGGLYLGHLRQAIYHHLIEAEKLLAPVFRDVQTNLLDYDCDGYDEIVVMTNKFTSIIKPSTGGMMLELDNREASFNITDTLKRRKEGYHWKLTKARLDDGKKHESDTTESIHDLVLTKESGLEKLLAEDWYLKRCFVDHFFPAEVDLHRFASGNFGNDGDFILEPWTYERGGKAGVVRMKREGHLWRQDGIKALRIVKSYYFGVDSEVISVNYSLTATNEDIKNIRFGVENNFNFLAGHAPDRYILFDGERMRDSNLDAVNRKAGGRSVIISDDWLKGAVALMVDREAEIWQAPIFTISLSEGGFEKVYQGTSLVNLFEINLKKGQPWEVTFMLYSGKPDGIPSRMTGERARTAMKT